MKEVKINSLQTSRGEIPELQDNTKRIHVKAEPDFRNIKTGRNRLIHITTHDKKLKDLFAISKDFKLNTADYNQIPPCLYTKEGEDIILHHTMYGKFKLVKED